MKRLYGWRKDRPGAHPILALPPDGAHFPKQFSLRGAMPPPYDQGQTNSCTGNGVASVLQFDRRRELKPDWVPSRKFPYYNGRVREMAAWEDGGAMICDVVDSLGDKGYCSETTCPFEDMETPPSAAAYMEGLQNLVPGRAKLVQNEAAFKAALLAHRPIICGIMVYQSFESAEVAQSGHVPLPKDGEPFMGGHCVVIVGWQPGAWEVRNSWGAGWGDHGYCWMDERYMLTPQLSSDFTIIPRV